MHGVIWLQQEDIRPFLEADGTFNKETISKLIDEWISVSIKTGDATLDNLVKDLNTHKHSKSCKKYGTECRFHFPRFPSDETLIAAPLPTDMTEEEKSEKLQFAKNIQYSEKKQSH